VVHVSGPQSWIPRGLLRWIATTVVILFVGTKRINHEEAYSLNGACTNCAEEFFSRMRRGEIGHHHHIAGAYLLRYAQEASWREDYRRTSNGDQVRRLSGLAVNHKPPVDFCGYWQRHIGKVQS
jgi:ISXO2-like transposase domain